MAVVNHTEFEEELRRARANENYLVPVENVRDVWDNESAKVIDAIQCFYSNPLLYAIVIANLAVR